MEQERRRRSTGKVDRLPPELKDTVEQMLLTGCTYKEIVAFLKVNGEEMSQMAICTYARKYLATVEMINVAQNNFSMLMDEMNRYPDLDTSEALIRLAREEGVQIPSSRPFCATGDLPGGLRLGYASLAPAEIEAGLDGLARALARLPKT
jgi:hypothetical protein